MAAAYNEVVGPANFTCPGINPATILNLDNCLFRFVDVAGKIGIVNSSNSGLMPSNGFYTKTTTLGANDLQTTGIYINVNNTPTYYGLLLVFSYGIYTSQFFLAEDGAVYTRMFNESGWTRWVRA